MTINGKEYKELRCSQCQKFIVHINAHAADVFYACPRCGYINEFTFKFLNIKSRIEHVLRWYSINKKPKLEGGE